MNHQTQGSFAPDLSVFTNYEYEADVDGNNALAYVLELNGSNKKVLEVGAGSGMMTKHLVKVKGCDVVGLEINPVSIEKLRSYIDRIYSLDLNNPSWTGEVAREGKFDTIIAADVLEHLYDPWTVLKGMKPLLNDTGSVIISLPHVAHSAVISCLIEEDFEYRDWGLFDKTHIRFFGLHNIHALHANAGLAVVDARFVVRRPEETEFADRWARLPASVRSALSYNRHGNVYQVVTKAVPIEKASGKPLDLFKVPVPTTGSKAATTVQMAKLALRLFKR